MDFILTKKLPENGALAFVLKEGEKIKGHGFFKYLSKDDQAYCTLLDKKNPIKNDHVHVTLLSSGRQALFFGAPQKAKFNHRKAMLFARKIVRQARKEKIDQLVVNVDDFMGVGEIRTREDALRMLALQGEMANFDFTDYKTRPKEGWPEVKAVHVLLSSLTKSAEKALAEGKIIGEEINKTRHLANTPGGDMTPALLARAAEKTGKEAGFKVKVLDEKEMAKLGMGGVLGVARGSAERPRFIIMEYMYGGKKEAPVVLVGKGVTFDTGGLNLKPESGIYEMHMDMSGGAAVIHTISALARLKVKKNIVGLVPAVENMPSGSSYHPGDLLRTMGGKTIEVLNTDAEGRVILADALEYAKQYAPRLVIDAATLTGSAMGALGQRASAIFSTDQKIERALRATGEQVGDFVWPLPLWEEYEEDVRGTFGDWANIGKTRYGGAITAAVFLWQFTKDKEGAKQAYPWVHLDIAPRMTTIESEYLAKGAAGAPVSLLTRFLRTF